jgi:hypothetical protein
MPHLGAVCAPGAAHVWAMPEVRVTWGFMTIKVSPTRDGGITVQPQARWPLSPPCAGYRTVYSRAWGASFVRVS